MYVTVPLNRALGYGQKLYNVKRRSEQWGRDSSEMVTIVSGSKAWPAWNSVAQGKELAEC